MCIDYFAGHEARDVLRVLHIKVSIINEMCVSSHLFISESGISSEKKLSHNIVLHKDKDCHSFSIHACIEIGFTSL